MTTHSSTNRSSPSPLSVREEDTAYDAESGGPSQEDDPSLPSQLPRRIESVQDPEGDASTFLIVGEDELDELLAVARQCKAQAKTIADSLLRDGSDNVTESNAVYGLERQMAELQKKIRGLKK